MILQPPTPMPASPAQPDRTYDELFAAAADRLALFIRLRFRGSAPAGAFDDEDLLQEVYLRGRRGFSGFDPSTGPGFLAWICTVARSAGIDEIRRGAVRSPQAVDVSRVLRLAEDPHTGPFTSAGRRELRAEVAEAIGALGEGDRDVLLARFFEGETQAAIAERMGVSLSAVQRSIARAVVAVGQPLRRLDGPSPAGDRS